MEDHSQKKYPRIDGIDFEDIRGLLRLADRSGHLFLDDAIRSFSCDAKSADRRLRDLSHAGYVTADLQSYGGLTWKRTILGNALAGEKKMKRIGSSRVKEIISSVVDRAREVNDDPNRLHRVRLKLFGSALDEDADDFGDVDISIEFIARSLEEQELERLRSAIRSRYSMGNLSFLEKLLFAEHTDMREIKSILKKGFGHLSLMGDDPASLGSSYRWLVDHDLVNDRAIECSDALVRTNSSPLETDDHQTELPSETVMKATYRSIADDRKRPIDKVSCFNAADVAELEGRVWTPVVNRFGELLPNDLRGDQDACFAGFQHLCSVWKEHMGALEMVERSLSWCDQRKVWLRDFPQAISISKGPRLNLIRYGFHYPKIFPVTVRKLKFDASLRPYTRGAVSRLDLAGAYSTAFALAKLYRDMGCFSMPHFNATIVLSDIPSFELPDLPKLWKKDGLCRGALDGRLLEFSLMDN